jgi:hypothetical protein
MALAGFFRSGNDFINQMTMHVGQTSVNSVISQRQFLMIYAKQM